MDTALPKANIFIDDISNGQENIKIPFINEVNFQTIFKDVTYIPNNILVSEVLTEEFESIPVPCECKDSCDIHCSCGLGSDIAFHDGLLSETYFSQITKPIVECSTLCTCTNCPNQVVQKGIRIHLQVFMTTNKGFGIKTLDFIPKYTFVCEYAGELIDKEEVCRRIKNRKMDEPNYIYVLNEYSSELSNTCTIIDPTHCGNVGRYLNHSCTPNLIPVPVRANSMVPRICFFAKHDIILNEELTYNYGTNINQERILQEPSLRDGDLNAGKKKCYCDSTQCVGFLPHDIFWL